MVKATLEDLMNELWLRRRFNGDIVWITQKGKVIPIKDMEDSHLVNTINMINREYDEMEHIGDGPEEK